MTLAQLPTNTWGYLLDMTESDPFHRRLRDFGLVAGTSVCPRYRSPDGAVTALEFRGTLLALRTKDLHRLQVGL